MTIYAMTRPLQGVAVPRGFRRTWQGPPCLYWQGGPKGLTDFT